MTLRDLTERQRRQLETEGDKLFAHWFKTTNGGKVFGSNVNLDAKTIYRAGYARAVNSVLSHVEEFYETHHSKTRSTRHPKARV